MTETIASQVQALHAGRDSNDVWAEEQRQLSQEHVEVIVPLGTAFPDADLQDAHGQTTTLTAVRAGRAAVVVFYRGSWCPYCNLTLRTYQQDLLEPLSAKGIALIAISPELPDGSLTMTEKNELEFPVLSDDGNRIAAALGILTAPSEDSRAAQMEHGLDVRTVNADGTAGLPMPTVAIIDRHGALLWSDVHPDYSTRTEVTQILGQVQHLGL